MTATNGTRERAPVGRNLGGDSCPTARPAPEAAARHDVHTSRGGRTSQGPRGERLAADERMRVAIFVRVASRMRDCQRLNHQLAICQQYARRRKWRLARRYAHVGAGRGPRPDLLALVADAKAGEFDVLLVESFDRLGREAARLHAVMETFRDLGIEVHTVMDEGAVTVRPKCIALRFPSPGAGQSGGAEDG